MVEERVVILGGGGMLGSDLALECEREGLNTTALDLPDFDITNFLLLQRAISDATIVVNCAAYTDVDKAESEPDLTYEVNAQAVGNLGAFAKEAGIWVLHISTDYIFDGKSKRPYVETDKPAPINAYGESKLEGEQLLIESGCRHCILRLEWTYGLNEKNFVTKLIERAGIDKNLRVVDDQTGSPTATTEVAKVICKLLPNMPEGIFHFASAGYVSRFEMAKFIFDKLDMPVNLSSCKTSDYPRPASRQLNSRFDCSKIQALLDEPIKPWQEPLEHFVKEQHFFDSYANKGGG